MIYFLLPAYNESKTIGQQVDSIHQGMKQKGLEYRLFIVNDGSKDETLEILEDLAKTYPLTILNHPVNRGVGAAFRTGFGELFKVIQPNDRVITMDADNTHKIRTVELMLARLEDGYEVVIASMFAIGGMLVGAPFYRFFLTWGCNLLYRILFHVKGIREYTGFFRAYHGGALLRLHEHFGEQLITAPGFACMAEFLVKCRRVAMLMTEVPMILRYDQKASVSALRVFPTIQSHLKIIAQNVFDRKIF